MATIIDDTTVKGPFKLVTVNTAPERAYRLIGQVADQLKDRYIIQHVTNCEKIEDVADTVQKHHPDLLFCASMWTAEQADEIQSTARRINPSIATYAIPHGLQVQKGPSAIVDHLVEVVPGVLETIK